MGTDRIEHEFKYKDIDEDLIEKVLERSDQSQSEMINGTIKALNAQGKEESLENINRYISRYATMVVETYFHLF
jgi:SOS response regulatory protein OraA/RecX